MVNGSPQIPMAGTRMRYRFDDGKAKVMIGPTENSFVNVKNTFKTITAKFGVLQGAENGAALCLVWRSS